MIKFLLYKMNNLQRQKAIQTQSKVKHILTRNEKNAILSPEKIKPGGAEMAEKQKLIIGADPGFDGFKLTFMMKGEENYVKVYNIPFSAIPLNGREKKRISSFSVKQNIMYETDGKLVLIGQKAREELMDEEVYKIYRSSVETFSNIERFDTDLFKQAMMAGILFGMYLFAEEYKEEKGKVPYELDNVGIPVYIGVALPHGYFEDYVDTIKGYVTRRHEGTLYAGDRELKVDFTPEHTVVSSQAVMVLVAQMYDDDGNMIKEPAVPQLILDAGYRTLGKVKISSAATFGLHDASDTTMAMANIDEEVIEAFNSIPKKYNTVLTKDVIAAGEKEREYIDKDGRMAVFKINDEKDKIIRKKIAELEESLESEYSGFMNIEQISFAGGTGKAYYEPFIDILKEKGLERVAERTKLIRGRIGGKEYDPVYTVSIGECLSVLSMLKAEGK